MPHTSQRNQLVLADLKRNWSKYLPEPQSITDFGDLRDEKIRENARAECIHEQRCRDGLEQWSDE